jgi:hypothetical protein
MNVVNCIEFDEQVALLLDGVASLALERALLNHTSSCQPCAALLKDTQGVRTLLQKSVVPGPSDALDARVMRGFQNRHLSFAAPRPWWREVLRIPRPALAMSLLTVVFALLLGIGIGRMSARQQSVSSVPPAALSPTPLSPKSATDQVVESQPPPAYAPVKSGIERNRPVSRRSAKTIIARTKPLESVTVVSSTGANYTTRAALDGFEPVTGTKLRVIKGGEEK